ncbi:MAG: hypothetical protein FWH23_03840 [Bacteroidales bacterium]|nr:hypothetical protein [Bacteroidales bacterium]MCL2133100.1 hypothetical protein [Bacteroidales bacterium]
MEPQENINKLLSKMMEALQTVRECENFMLEEIRQIELLREEKSRLNEQIADLDNSLLWRQKEIEEMKEEEGRLNEQIAVLNEDLLLKQKEIETIKVSTVPEITAEEVQPKVITPPSPPMPEPVRVPEPIPVPVPEPVPVPPPTLVAEKPIVETLADKFQGQLSVHDKIAVKPEATTTGAKVNDLAKAISINDRLLFIKELFGTGELFTQTVRQLNGLQNFDEALLYLNTAFPHWDATAGAVQLFISLVRRRFL